jgi:hypothetical protein
MSEEMSDGEKSMSETLKGMVLVGGRLTLKGRALPPFSYGPVGRKIRLECEVFQTEGSYESQGTDAIGEVEMVFTVLEVSVKEGGRDE